MSSLEETLKSVLGDPESMGKIMELARSLGGSDSRESTPQPPDVQEETQEDSPPPLAGLMQSLLGGGEDTQTGAALPALPDPELTGLVMKLFSAWNSAEHSEKTEILQALRTASRPERQKKIDRALRAVRLAHLAHEALGRGEEGEHHGF